MLSVILLSMMELKLFNVSKKLPEMSLRDANLSSINNAILASSSYILVSLPIDFSE